MPTRNVVLTEHHDKVILDLVASGRYQNASDVLRDGLRLIEERESRDEASDDASGCSAHRPHLVSWNVAPAERTCTWSRSMKV